MKFKIHVCSMFKDSQTWGGFNINQVNRFFEQILKQQLPWPIEGEFSLVSGISQDNTSEVLKNYQDELSNREESIKVNLYLDRPNKYFNAVQSTVNPNRIKGLSETGSFLLSNLDFSSRPISEQFVLWLESDFIVPNNLLSNLLRMSLRYKAVVAPLPLHENGSFYDTWAFETNTGEKWTNQQFIKSEGPIPMNSIGSCALIPADYINKGVTFGLGAFPELCLRIKEYNGLILCDSDTHIWHPSKYIVNGRAI